VRFSETVAVAGLLLTKGKKKEELIETSQILKGSKPAKKLENL
jgi:hypothetical protein